MNRTELLTAELRSEYKTTERLLTMVEDDVLAWKPSEGNNWMTTGQLLKHLTEACGAACRAFVTGDWGLPEGTDINEVLNLPAADRLPTIESVAAAKLLVEKDKQLAFEMVAACSEERLATEKAPAPWDPTEIVLGYRLLQMVEHLKQHKGQLFYYLKLQGKPVATADLWGT